MRMRMGVAVLSMLSTLMASEMAGAELPISRDRPFEAVCESQGGTFSVSTDLKDLYCNKEGPLFTAFTPAQLDVQRRLCHRLYGAFFGVQGVEYPDGTTETGTFCATSA